MEKRARYGPHRGQLRAEVLDRVVHEILARPMLGRAPLHPESHLPRERTLVRSWSANAFRTYVEWVVQFLGAGDVERQRVPCVPVVVHVQGIEFDREIPLPRTLLQSRDGPVVLLQRVNRFRPDLAG